MTVQYVREAIIASGDMAASVRFHREAFDFEVLGEGDDGVLLGVAGTSAGHVRVVPAADSPDEPSAEAAAVWDRGGRLLGIYSHDLAATEAAMIAAGGEPRTPVTYPYGQASLSELVGRGVDGIWWTIPLAVPGAHRPSAAYEASPERLHSELHTAVLVVEDHDAAVNFFTAAGLDVLFDGTMSGSPFDELVGIPADGALRLAFLVGPLQSAARLEIMSFTGVEAQDRTASSVGMKRLVFVATDVDQARNAMLEAGGEDLGDGVLRGPAGVEIELVEEQA